MHLEHLRVDRTFFDFHETEKGSSNIKVDIILLELLPDGFFPKAYQCLISQGEKSFEKQIRKNFQANALQNFVLLGEVNELERGNKTLFLKDGRCIFYNRLVIVSKTESTMQQSLQKQEEEFIRALQSLLEAIRLQAKMAVTETLSAKNEDHVRKLRAMTTMVSSEKSENESLAAIQNSGKQTSVREPQNRLFELHL